MRTIDADALKEAVDNGWKPDMMVSELWEIIDEAPTVGGEVRTPDGKGYWMVPVDETRLVRHYSRPGVYADLWLHCEKCGGMVDDRYAPKYCPDCGRKVKWDG